MSQALALFLLEQYPAAESAYLEGLSLEPENNTLQVRGVSQGWNRPCVDQASASGTQYHRRGTDGRMWMGGGFLLPPGGAHVVEQAGHVQT